MTVDGGIGAFVGNLGCAVIYAAGAPLLAATATTLLLFAVVSPVARVIARAKVVKAQGG